MTTKELYDEIICNPQLHSRPKLYDNRLIWHLYKNAYMCACCNGADSFLEIFGGDGFTGSLIHMHLDEEELYKELFALGKRVICALSKNLVRLACFLYGRSVAVSLSRQKRMGHWKKEIRQWYTYLFGTEIMVQRSRNPAALLFLNI